MRFSSNVILRFGIFLFVQFTVVVSHANKADLQLVSDTSCLNSDSTHLLGTINGKINFDDMMDDSIETELLNSSDSYLNSTINQNALLHFIQSNKFKNEFRDKKRIKKVYGKLAKIFAIKKYYPIAMQYYYETLTNNIGWYNSVDTNKNNETIIANFNNENNNVIDSTATATDEYTNAKFLSSSFQETYFNYSRLFFTSRKGTENNSVPIKNNSVSNNFYDEKHAVAYAVIIHVKQPKAGRRKAFTGINNVGHTFITLVKYNADSTCTVHSFGFYPQKDNFFSATPLHPASSSVFKDDTVHDWDEAVGKFISERRFKKLLKLIVKFENKKYNLNNNNCTDFGLYAANVVGISISNTIGSWPLGYGNNPANAGQSILEGKFINTDTGNTQGLFICAGTR